MSEPLTVLTWFWHQPEGRTRYEPLHVNIWADMVRRNLSMPHRIACVTATPEGIDSSVEIITPPTDFDDVRIPTWKEKRPQCHRRLTMFAPDAGKIFGERFVCMDLDTVIHGKLDPLFDHDDEFRMFRGTSIGRPYNGSMMQLTAGSRPQVFEEFTPQKAVTAGRLFTGSDQAWISHCLGAGEATWGSEHGATWHGDRNNLTDPRIVFFPGSGKPWHFFGHDKRITRDYRRQKQQGRCLILGYGGFLWDDVAEALEQGSFETVIALRESASLWPDPVAAVAIDDFEARLLAIMAGYDETQIAHCGQTAAVDDLSAVVNP